MIGDKDPEDAWDDVDPLETKLRVLLRVAVALRDSERDDRFDARRVDAIRLLGKLDDTVIDHVQQLRQIRDILEAL